MINATSSIVIAIVIVIAIGVAIYLGSDNYCLLVSLQLRFDSLMIKVYQVYRIRVKMMIQDR